MIYGEGCGVVLTKDGKETVTWTGQGIGRFVSQGRIRFAGSLFYRTSSSGQLGFLNNLVGVFEYESDEQDEQGNSSSRIRVLEYGNGNDALRAAIHDIRVQKQVNK
jgi:hypothetical protein